MLVTYDISLDKKDMELVQAFSAVSGIRNRAEIIANAVAITGHLATDAQYLTLENSKGFRAQIFVEKDAREDLEKRSPRGRTRVNFRLQPRSAQAIENIRQRFNLESDAAAIRFSLALVEKIREAKNEHSFYNARVISENWENSRQTLIRSPLLDIQPGLRATLKNALRRFSI